MCETILLLPLTIRFSDAQLGDFAEPQIEPKFTIPPEFTKHTLSRRKPRTIRRHPDKNINPASETVVLYSILISKKLQGDFAEHKSQP